MCLVRRQELPRIICMSGRGLGRTIFTRRRKRFCEVAWDDENNLRCLVAYRTYITYLKGEADLSHVGPSSITYIHRAMLRSEPCFGWSPSNQIQTHIPLHGWSQVRIVEGCNQRGFVSHSTWRPQRPVSAPDRLLLSARHQNWPDASDHPMTASGQWKNNRFTSRKAPNPASQARREGERIPIPSPPLKLYILCKCANTDKCSPPCARVLAFSQSFSQRS
jgi:hypothetical protein